jgi:hypothetical protein
MNLKMLKMVVAGVTLSVSSFANAVLVLQADLSVENTITIIATSGTSSLTVSGSTVKGFYLNDFFDSDMSFALRGNGDLTSANNTNDNSPIFYSVDNGLNLYDFTDTDMAFTLEEIAFSGQASVAVSAASYASALAGAQGGSVFAPADTNDDVADANLIGTWEVTNAEEVPEPSTLAILGLGLLGLASRRFKKKS